MSEQPSRRLTWGMAVLAVGLFWGWTYLRYGSVVLNVVSHLVWDLAVFLVLPFE